MTRRTLVAALGGRTAELASQGLLILLLPALLGAAAFGAFAVVQGFVMLGSVAAAVGGPTLMARLVAATPAAERASLARAVLLEGLRWRVAALMLAVAAAAGLAAVVPDDVPPVAVGLGAVALAFDAGGTWASYVALALGHVAAWSYRYAVQNTTTAAAVAVGYGVAGGDGALGGLVVGAAAGLAWTVRFSAEVVRAPSVAAPEGTRQLAALLTLSGLAPQVAYRLLVPLVALGAGTAAAGNAAIGLGVALAAIYTIAHPFAAAMPELLRRGETAAKIEATLLRLGRQALVVAGLISVVGAALGPPLVPLLLGAEFRPAAAALGLAVASVPLATAGVVLGQVAALHLRLRARAVATSAGAIVAVALCGALARSVGTDAVGLGLLGSSLTVVLAGRTALNSRAVDKLGAASIAVSAVVLLVALASR